MALQFRNWIIFFIVFDATSSSRPLSQRNFFKKNARDFRGIREAARYLDFGWPKTCAISDVRARVWFAHIRYFATTKQNRDSPAGNAQEWPTSLTNNSALFRLAVVQRARETGFTLEEIRELFFGFCGRDASTEALAISSPNERSRNSGNGSSGFS